MNPITADDLCWHHKGTTVFAIHSDYTITDAILTDPKTTRRYSLFVQEDGDEVFVESHSTIEDVLDVLNYLTADRAR